MLPGEKLTREDILHLYLSALLLKIGGTVTLTLDELAAADEAKIKHVNNLKTEAKSIELRVEANPGKLPGRRAAVGRRRRVG